MVITTAHITLKATFECYARYVGHVRNAHPQNALPMASQRAEQCPARLVLSESFAQECTFGLCSAILSNEAPCKHLQQPSLTLLRCTVSKVEGWVIWCIHS